MMTSRVCPRSSNGWLSFLTRETTLYQLDQPLTHGTERSAICRRRTNRLMMSDGLLVVRKMTKVFFLGYLTKAPLSRLLAAGREPLLSAVLVSVAFQWVSLQLKHAPLKTLPLPTLPIQTR